MTTKIKQIVRHRLTYSEILNFSCMSLALQVSFYHLLRLLRIIINNQLISTPSTRLPQMWKCVSEPTTPRARIPYK